MNKVELGAKLSCQACGIRFYDLNRQPVVCPACSVPYTPKERPMRLSRSPHLRKPMPLAPVADEAAIASEAVESDEDDATLLDPEAEQDAAQDDAAKDVLDSHEA